jgi:serine/threonine protein kinase
VAIKEISKDMVDKSGDVGIQHIFREKNIMNSLNGHQFIINLLCTAKDEKNLYFVTDIAANGTLDDLFKTKKTLPIPVVRAITAQIAYTIDFFHSKNIAHRDLKPNNIMFDDNWNIKIIDFGEAKDLSEAEVKNEEVGDE